MAILSNRARHQPAYAASVDSGAHAKQAGRPTTAATTP